MTESFFAATIGLLTGRFENVPKPQSGFRRESGGPTFRERPPEQGDRSFRISSSPVVKKEAPGTSRVAEEDLESSFAKKVEGHPARALVLGAESFPRLYEDDATPGL
jgi:hypothetical protein